MRKLTVVFVAVLAASSLSCNRAAPETTDKPKVALVLKTLNHPFFVDMRRGAQEAADRLGVQLEVQAAEREIDVEKQMQIVENMIQTGIKALVITPSGSREIVPALVKAQNANVPIVIVDTRVSSVYGEGHIPGALLLPLEGALTWPESYEKVVSSLIATKKPVVTYCA